MRFQMTPTGTHRHLGSLRNGIKDLVLLAFGEHPNIEILESLYDNMLLYQAVWRW